MFGAIAPRYDLLNHLLSANLDRSWRRAAAAALGEGRLDRVLDLCGGTGDLSLAVRSRAKTVVCCDFSHPMLARASRKFTAAGASDCLLVEGDGLRLPFDAGTFDAVTVGFGLRNFVDRGAGLREIHRVLAPGGVLVVLEFSRPHAPVLSGLYRFYLSRVLPRLGDRISRRDGPYGYLARTVADFPPPAELAGLIEAEGFRACRWEARSGGIVAIHRAERG